MRVLITGATGLIGNEIVKRCHTSGIAVNYLTTRRTKIATDDNYKGFFWNPENNEINVNCIKDVDAIIHLAGASISKRWTRDYKKMILDSRVKSTDLLFNTLKNNEHNITHMISGSAIGIYPKSLTNYYSETEIEPNSSFLGEVVKQWEESVDAFSKLNISTTKIRIGLVLSNKGGALPQMVKPIRYCFGANMGSGKQWMSWIHLRDLANLFLYVLENKLEGVYNAVAPNPATNREFNKALAEQLKRPLILPNVPKFVMRVVLGEMHMLLFESQRVSSKKIENAGFNFNYFNLKSALENLL